MTDTWRARPAADRRLTTWYFLIPRTHYFSIRELFEPSFILLAVGPRVHRESNRRCGPFRCPLPSREGLSMPPLMWPRPAPPNEPWLNEWGAHPSAAAPHALLIVRSRWSNGPGVGRSGPRGDHHSAGFLSPPADVAEPLTSTPGARNESRKLHWAKKLVSGNGEGETDSNYLPFPASLHVQICNGAADPPPPQPET